MRELLRTLSSYLLATLMAGVAYGQQIAIQQPVVENFSAATTVSVPDRGSVFIGGVSSAASSRSVYGPFRTGSSLGISRQSSSMTAHVYIHDFEAMDAALLSEAPVPRTSRLDPRVTNHLAQRAAAVSTTSDAATASLNTAQEAERLAEQAEARGKFSVAKLHWQRAARHGSAKAQERLAAR